jgi:hypothetical protein
VRTRVAVRWWRHDAQCIRWVIFPQVVTRGARSTRPGMAAIIHASGGASTPAARGSPRRGLTRPPSRGNALVSRGGWKWPRAVRTSHPGRRSRRSDATSSRSPSAPPARVALGASESRAKRSTSRGVATSGIAPHKA